MSYFGVWLVQAVIMILWTKFVSSSPMSLDELLAGIYFSAAALFMHWCSHRAASQPPGAATPKGGE